MRHLWIAAAAIAAALAGGSGLAQAPANSWHAKGRALLEQAVEIPTVPGRRRMGDLIGLLRREFEAAGISDIQVHPHGDTETMIVRWPAPRRSGRKAILLLAHMDVVEARREDWERDPFEFIEEGGYFYGRGVGDDKQGVVAVTTALLRLRAAGFQPSRDIIVLFTGDEETDGVGAERAASQWIDLSQVEFGLNADAGGGAFRPDGTLLGFSYQTSEKVYQDFTFSARNPGGHSSRPRPDNAIYELAASLQRLGQHRFTPRLNETTRAYLSAQARISAPEVAAAIHRWLADENDGEAADLIEASEAFVGMTRTRCVATMLAGGHAPNALPQRATANVNCRIFPGDDPAEVLTTLRAIAAPSNVSVEPVDSANPSPPSPLRPDVVGAFTAAVHARHPGAAVIPSMSTGATDSLFFRARGLPVYGVNGLWIEVPTDERAHGLNERIPVRAFYENIDHWTDMIGRLAGPAQRGTRRRR